MKSRSLFTSFILFFLLALAGCVGTNQATNSTNSDSTTEDEDTPSTPVITDYTHFYKDSSKQQNLIISESYILDTFLRGDNVNSYVKNNFSQVSCLTIAFAAKSGNPATALIVALRPGNVYDSGANEVEYYYTANFADDEVNKVFCNNSGVTNFVDQNYIDTSSIVFDIEDVCPSCTVGEYLSNALNIVTKSGIEVDDISTTGLSTTIDYSNVINDPTLVTCTDNVTCTAQGYDCCSGYSCVNDKTIKNGVDNSHPDYDQAIQSVILNPASYINFPQIYNICENVTEPVDPTTPDDDDDELDYLTELKELYECTTPIKGEMSVCTIRYKDINPTEAFYVKNDDRTFAETYAGRSDNYESDVIPFSGKSIYEVTYANELLYSNRQFTDGNEDTFTFGPSSDDLTSANYIENITYTPEDSNDNRDLIIKYMIDGSCTEVNSTKAKCSKYYVKGQNTGDIDDFAQTDEYELPPYADRDQSIILEVDGYRKQRGVHWSLIIKNTAPFVKVITSELKIEDTQTVKITFYVNTTSEVNSVLLSKTTALNQIKEMCKCSSTTNCRLTPVYYVSNGVSSIKDYKCSSQDPDDDDSLLDQVVNVTGKNVPQRLFDINGVAQTELTGDEYTLQDSDGNDLVAVSYQEGNKFEYTNGDYLKPNNIDSSNIVGFNEIYGSFTPDSSSALPAKQVTVQKGHTYDFTVNSGLYSSCISCGTDYYSRLKMLFPDSYVGFSGGGYQPSLDATTTDKFNPSHYRADDILFGRACFVPATMIPWTHPNTYDDVQQQRLARMDAQHFLYANGYQKDWFGFDYGSLIGSFDGVSWFSIGTRRRIEAQTDKLFLAVNGAFGDLAQNYPFQVRVVDVTSFSSSSVGVPEYDYETTGAECREFHQCETDSDCITQLGWDYSCQDVSGAKTSWPTFTQAASEIPGSSTEIEISDLIGGLNPASTTRKRCAYRGRGTPCEAAYDQASSSNSFHKTDQVGLSSCSSNNYCQGFSAGSDLNKFNNKIWRYAHAPESVNSYLGMSKDTFGLSTGIIGRPYDYNGEDLISSTIRSTFNNNSIAAICIPGKEASTGGQSFIGQHIKAPNSYNDGDKVNNIGSTPVSAQATHYLSSCGILDEDNNFIRNNENYYNEFLASNKVSELAAGQALPTNSLLNFINMVSENDFLLNFTSNQVDSAALEENRCLRAPNSPCFTDLDCGPSYFLSNKLMEIDETNTVITNAINKYEISFWREGLVCGQKEPKTSDDYDLTQNRCCREIGKSLTLPTFKNQLGEPVFSLYGVPAIDDSITDASRNSRNSVIYKELKNLTLPPLETPSDDSCTGDCASISSVEDQSKTLNITLSRMCCSQSWVRKFNADDNGGGHTWGPGKAQNVSKKIFKCLNWNVCPSPTHDVTLHNKYCGTEGGFDCSHASGIVDSSCTYKPTSVNEAKDVFDFMGGLELTGIPQVGVKSEDFEETNCIVDYDYQYVGYTGPLKETIKSSSQKEYVDSTGQEMFSAADSTNFEDDIKTVFSKDQFACCLSVGETVPTGETADVCCSGHINGNTNKCALADYADVSLYFNRFISSEGAELSDNLYDAETGYIKTATAMMDYACIKEVCASDTVALGVAHSTLKVPGLENDTGVLRFVDDNSSASNIENVADFYDAGLRWNTHVYCFPESTEDFSGTTNLTVRDCGNN